MKRASDYLLQTIDHAAYLLPYGQSVAEHKPTLSLNEVGVFLWELLEHALTREEILARFLEEYLEEEADREALTKDLDQFLNYLIGLRIIEDDAPDRQNQGTPGAWLRIGGLTLAYYGPADLIMDSNLREFCVDPADRADQKISIFWDAPVVRADSTVLFNSAELLVCESDTEYRLLFPTLSKISEAAVAKDGKGVRFYCKPPNTKELSTQFFDAYRFVFLYLAQLHDMYAIHSVSICYRDRAWLFSASSGTGKSTHANLWKELYQTAVINGDLNLLAMENGTPVIHGIPWCGTSEIFDKTSYPLGGIIFLKQFSEDVIAELSPAQKTLRIMQRFISPTWTAQGLKANLDFAGRLAPQILMCQLQCTKNPSAAALMKRWIDQNDMAGK